MRAMLLAAGRGKRLRPLTDRIPKALVEVAGASLIEHHLRRVADAGVTVAVVNLGWHGEAIVSRLGSGRRYGLQIVYSPEYDRVLETGGGVVRALPLLGDEPFWVVNTDIYTAMPLPAMDLAKNASGRLVLVPTPADRDHGDFALAGGRVRMSDRPTLTYAGFACYRPSFFASCKPGHYSLAPLMFAAAGRGELQGTVYEGLWSDVGTPARLAELERRLQAGGQAAESPVS